MTVIRMACFMRVALLILYLCKLQTNVQITLEEKGLSRWLLVVFKFWVKGFRDWYR